MTGGTTPTLRLVGVVIGTLIGTVITVVGGIVGGILTHRRDYSRWLREQRRSAYADLLDKFETAAAVAQLAERDRRNDWPELVTATRSAASHVAILGPSAAADAADRLATIAGQISPTTESINSARDIFALAARTGLRSIN